ncbi:hypothetical protein PMIT1318_02659 [Prochlorococcus marinus str. MIT 1318]|nr:hypothetical protein PMIT1318_02659 [Prochlorococcus marinus str. MIT 1318]
MQILIVHSDLHLFKKINTRLGHEDEEVEANLRQFQLIVDLLKHKIYVFHFSLYGSDTNCSSFSDWSNIIYLHIPKCAGTSFQLPVNKFFTVLEEKGRLSRAPRWQKYFVLVTFSRSFM